MLQKDINIYLVLDINLTLQDKYMFDLVHLKQKEGWQLKGATIVIQTNFFSLQ
jgi:hypothetical protein